jgi:peptide/nickel transport system substrate-binding protein
MKNPVFLAITLLTMLILLASCAPAAPDVIPTAPAAKPSVALTAAPVTTAAKATPSVQIQRGGALRAAVQNDWVGLFPLVNTVGERTVHYMMFDQWTEYEMDDTGKWVLGPRLVAEWDQKPDAVTLKLQKGVKFHDGSDWNAEVAKWYLEQVITNPKSNGKGYFLEVDLNKTEVVDSYTLKVGLKRPSAPFVVNLSRADAMPVSKAAFGKSGEAGLAQSPVGTGPFVFVKEVKGDSVVMRRNENYWRKGVDNQNLPYTDDLTIRLIIDDSVRLLELKAGSIDFTELVSGKDIPGIQSNPDLVFVEGLWSGNHYRMPFNSRGGAFGKSLKLRQAAQYAIDRDSVAKTLGQGAGRPLKYLLPPGNLGYDESYPFYGYDKGKAQQLMNEAGFPNGTDVKMTVISRVLDTQMCQIVQQMWAAIGLRSTIDVLERAAFVSLVVTGEGDYEVGSVRNPTSISDPDSTYRNYFHSKGTTNYFHWNDVEMDKCIDEGASTYDENQRAAIYRRCQQLTYESALFNYVWTQTWNWAFNKKVQGMMPAPAITNAWHFDRAWIKK